MADAPPPKKALPPLLVARLAARGLKIKPAEPAAEEAAARPPPPPPPPPTTTTPPLLLHPAASPPLPPGWYPAFDVRYGVPYFFNPDTGARSWIPPGFPPPPRHPAAAGLPEGWDVGVDGRRGGSIYYYCVQTGERTWDRPGGGGGGGGGDGAPTPTAPDFAPSPSFTGPRPGCVFKMGPKGLGYYADVRRDGVQAAGTPTAARGSIGPAAPPSAAPPPAAAPRPAVKRAPAPPPQPTRKQEIDPMDPAAYSDAPVGGWGSGLEKARGGG